MNFALPGLCVGSRDGWDRTLLTVTRIYERRRELSRRARFKMLTRTVGTNVDFKEECMCNIFDIEESFSTIELLIFSSHMIIYKINNMYYDLFFVRWGTLNSWRYFLSQLYTHSYDSHTSFRKYCVSHYLVRWSSEGWSVSRTCLF